MDNSVEQSGATEQRNDGCICKGNWRLIISEVRDDFDKIYEYRGEQFRFFGLVHASDDYYYGMSNVKDHSVQLLSCVGNIEGFGFTKVEPPKTD